MCIWISHKFLCKTDYAFIIKKTLSVSLLVVHLLVFKSQDKIKIWIQVRYNKFHLEFQVACGGIEPQIL
jgi:hypothetical protein